MCVYLYIEQVLISENMTSMFFSTFCQFLVIHSPTCGTMDAPAHAWAKFVIIATGQTHNLVQRCDEWAWHGSGHPPTNADDYPLT